MAKGKITVDITKSDYVYIDGATGKRLTKEQFNSRHNTGIRSILGSNRVSLSAQEGEGEESEVKEL